MTDEANQAAANADVQPSQIIEERGADPNAQGQGVKVPEPEQKAEDKKPLSTRDAIAKAFDENEAKAKEKAEAEKPKDDAAKADEKAKAETEAKPDPKQADKADEKAEDSDKAAKTDDQAEKDKSAADKPAAGQGGDEARQSEGRKHAEPPARFLPEARTKWANVPNEVKAEVHRVSQEYEREVETLKTESKETSERYEPLRKYDDQARQNGRTLEQSLQKVTQIEQSLAKNPVIGIEMILREIGPRKANGAPLSLYDIAQHIVQSKITPQQFQQNMQSALGQQQRPQGNGQQPAQQQSPEVAALSKELQEIKSQLATTRTQPIIDNFKTNRPDYQQLEPQIAAILKSGVVQQIYGSSLTPEQKLEQAYRMAGGQGPASQSAAPAPASAHSQAEPASPVDPDGQKSIKGAPSSGKTGESKPKFKSNRAALEAAFDAVR